MGGPIDFLRLFHPDGPWVLTAIPVDREGIETATFCPLEEERARRFIEERDGKSNLYFSVNVPQLPLHKKARRADIRLVRYFHVDIDARARDPLPDELTRIRRLLTDERPADVPAPTFIVDSGGGSQAFWQLLESIVINGDLNAAEDAARYNKRLEIVFGGDKCHNIDRIMRLPGTWNVPDAKKKARGRVAAIAEVYSHKPENVYPLSAFTPVPRVEVVTSDAGAKVVGSLDQLAKWDVPERVKTVITQGHDPDTPKQGDNSRSAWVFDVVCQLARHGVPDEIVLAIITNPSFKISESVLEKGKKADEYARRQVERANEAVAKEPPLLSQYTPVHSAREFVQRRLPTLMHNNDEWLAHSGAAYVGFENATIKAQVYAFLDAALKRGKDPPMPFCPDRSKVAYVIDALQGLVHRPRDMFTPPSWLGGTGPSPLELVACQNGLLQLSTGELHALTPRFFTRNALEFDYDAGAPLPTRWLGFLRELWPEDNDSDVVDTLQEVFGYLLNPDTAQQKMFIFVGPLRSGKGTVARVLTHLVGKRNTCAPTFRSMTSEFGLEPLIGKQLAIVSDVRLGAKSDHAAIAENLLRISGEDLVTANRKFKSAWHGKLAVRFLIMTNQMPQFADASGALANRFVPLVMRQSFLGREDPGLLAKLLPELPGILNWAIVGWRRLRERGHFVLPASSREAVLHLANLASPEAAFIRDECDLVPDAVVPKPVLYMAYKAWCGRSGDLSPGTPEVFSSRLQAAANGRVDTTKPREEGGRRVPSFRGIRLRDELPF